jgi:hypothetical protein
MIGLDTPSVRVFRGRRRSGQHAEVEGGYMVSDERAEPSKSNIDEGVFHRLVHGKRGT